MASEMSEGFFGGPKPEAEAHDAENDKFRDPDPRGGKIELIEGCKSMRGHAKTI